MHRYTRPVVCYVTAALMSVAGFATVGATTPAAPALEVSTYTCNFSNDSSATLEFDHRFEFYQPINKMIGNLETESGMSAYWFRTSEYIVVNHGGIIHELIPLAGGLRLVSRHGWCDISDGAPVHH